MQTTCAVPPPTHREVTPVRTCPRCHCYLRSYTDSDYCDPCSKFDLGELAPVDHIAAVAEMRGHVRRQEGFDALLELMEQSGVAA